MNTFHKLVTVAAPAGYRTFSLSSTNNATHSCKLLVIGGGSGGCTIAAKFARRLKKDSVIVLEPSTSHYYQPLWPLVAAGMKKIEDTHREAQSVLPSKAKWIRDRAEYVDPEKGVVTTEQGDTINYEYVVIAVGLENHYDKIPGLFEALENKESGVSTIYSAEYCQKTFKVLQQFKGGVAVFTYPDTPIKCPGAPQKIAYLSDSFMNKTGVRSKATMYYNTSLPVLFGVKKYANELLKVAKRKNINVNYNYVLKEVRMDRKEAVFYTDDKTQETTITYDFLHTTPPMRTPEFLRSNEALADPTGYLSVDKFTLQHTKYKNVYGIGDCTNTPNSKTAAAVARQCYVLEHNLLSTMASDSPLQKYDGYGACPLLTSYSTCILAEFLYDGEIHETLPFDQSKENRLGFYMKRDLFPFIYWNFMLKGYYHGPEFVRKIVNPFNWN